MNTCHRYTSYVRKKPKENLSDNMIYNIAVSEEGTSQIKNVMNDNTTAGTTENATSGKTNICEKFKIINSNENMHLYIRKT